MHREGLKRGTQFLKLRSENFCWDGHRFSSPLETEIKGQLLNLREVRLGGTEGNKCL